ncbi:MAG TPA: hypothetical protein PLU72_13365 [Candidatus Ozemobacteraceae bacterium]|nr:hypothetical protein [Candidatus Ozemobacteraceae bacterium]HQG28609.1 hypothetical protein [Candidatus Ozemobacteraceae bacterium]
MYKYISFALFIVTIVSSCSASGAEVGSSLAEKLRALREKRGGAVASAVTKLPDRPAAPPPAAQTPPAPSPKPTVEAEPDLADPDGVLADLETRRPADAIDWKPVVSLPDTAHAQTGPEEAAKSPGLLVSAGGEPFLLEPRERQISALDPASGRLTLFSRDRSPGLIETADAAVLGNEGLALADNSRQAVYLFRAFRHAATIGLVGERRLFRYIRHLFALPDGRFAVSDAGANRSFLFGPAGEVLAEIDGTIEPVWLGGKFVRLFTDEKRVRAVAVDPGSGRESPLFTYTPTSGRLPLDARAVGTAGSGNELVVLVSEGTGDADHPAWSRVLRYRAGALRMASVLPDLSFDLAGRRSCVLIDHGGTANLLALRQTSAGIGIFAADLP